MARLFLCIFMFAFVGVGETQAQDVDNTVLEDQKANNYTVEVKESPSGIVFKDEGFKDFCLRDKHLDADRDGMITEEEAKAATKLSLMNFRSFMRNIKTYDDLQYFPNLEYFHAGYTYVETVDVSCCPKLKELDLSDCRMLKKIILAKGCNPEIRGKENVQVEYAKEECAGECCKAEKKCCK